MPAGPCVARLRLENAMIRLVLRVLAFAGLLGWISAQAALSDQVALGRLLFFDRGLSASGRLACASCHDPRYAYGPPPGLALGLGGPNMDQRGTRAVPSLRYLHRVPRFDEALRFADGDVGPGGGLTWDGRAATLHDQARLPLLAPDEMANADLEEVVSRLRRAEFRRVFGADIFQRPASAFEAALLALEAFQQQPDEFYPYSSKYDAFLRGEVDLSAAEVRGAALFKDPSKGNCASCHVSAIRGGEHPAFTDFDFANVGVPRNHEIAANADPAHFDLGLCGPVRKDLEEHKAYCGMFRAPSLRNVASRSAFFHNGALHSLREVLHFYVERDLQPQKWYPRGSDGKVRKFDDLPPDMADTVDRDPPLDRAPGQAPALSDDEIEDMIAFLRTLSDSDVAELP
jgi:cytochrome c peroxidase